MKRKFVISKPILSSIFLGIIYLVGLIGLTFPMTHSIFIELTPITLFITFMFLLIHHQSENIKYEFSIFSIIFMLGFLIEVIGVNTGKIFGNYRYGEALGVKFFEAPIIIGLNWLMLSYVTTSIISNYRLNKFFVVILASVLMLIFDIILEQVAPVLDFWHWKSNSIPVNNFIAWFFLAVLFNSLIQFFNVSTRNSIARNVYLIQLSFFIMIYIVAT